jgi:hypothetical protein
MLKRLYSVLFDFRSFICYWFFSFDLFFELLRTRVKRCGIRGFTSKRLLSASISLPSLMFIPTTPEVLERRENFVFAIGLQEFQTLSHSWILDGRFCLELGVSGIPFSGLKLSISQ